MADLLNLPCRDANGYIHVVVEAPRGSLVKLRYEPSLGVFTFHRALPLGLAYPYDFGFVPSTRAADGNPLDAMVMFDAPTWPGVVIRTRPLGIVRVRQTEDKKTVHNDRVIAVPADDERYDDISDLPAHVREELEDFFVKVGTLPGKKVKVTGWERIKAAKHAVDAAALTYVKTGNLKP